MNSGKKAKPWLRKDYYLGLEEISEGWGIKA